MSMMTHSKGTKINMTEEISEELGDIASKLSTRRSTETEDNYSGSTGDVVNRLEKIGIHTHKAKVAEVADMLFEGEVRVSPNAHRRINDKQFEVLARAFLLYVNFSYEFEEIADFISGRSTYDDILFRLKAGLVLIDEIAENSGISPDIAKAEQA